MGTYRGGTKSMVQYMKEKETQTQAEGGTQTNWRDLYVSLRNNLPGANVVSEQYGQLMEEKYPDPSSRPTFDHDVWVTASGGTKKGYVKGIGFKRSRPSNFTNTCTSGSANSVGGSTTTSAASTS